MTVEDVVMTHSVHKLSEVNLVFLVTGLMAEGGTHPLHEFVSFRLEFKFR